MPTLDNSSSQELDTVVVPQTAKLPLVTDLIRLEVKEDQSVRVTIESGALRRDNGDTLKELLTDLSNSNVNSLIVDFAKNETFLNGQSFSTAELVQQLLPLIKMEEKVVLVVPESDPLAARLNFSNFSSKNLLRHTASLEAAQRLLELKSSTISPAATDRLLETLQTQLDRRSLMESEKFPQERVERRSLTIDLVTENKTLTIRPKPESGRIRADSAAWYRLEATLEQVKKDRDSTLVVIDLRDCTNIPADMANLLVSLHRNLEGQGRQLKIENVPKHFREALNLKRLDQLLRLVP